MRGRTGAILGLFALTFVGMGVLFGALMPPEARYAWPGVLHVAFVLIGGAILTMAIYGAARNCSFYTSVDQDVIEWGRTDKGAVAGSVQISNLSKCIYIEGIDAGFEVILVDASGLSQKIPGEYLFSDSEAKRLMAFVRQNFRNIEVIQK